MTVTKGFFDQYSVFCVFGSVVGCVVVPLITQVLKSQSMECMILSAIVISLTAAHLNKKTSESTANKIVVKENDKKKSQNQLHKRRSVGSSNTQIKDSTRNEDEYVQQFEHLKLLEMERRLEEKKLRKCKKREEKLKRREEEMKKQQDLGRKLKHLYQEKKSRRHEKVSPKNIEDCVRPSLRPPPGSTLDLLDSCDSAACYMQSLTSSDESRRRFVSCQRIPRFERQRLSSAPTASTSSYADASTKPLSIPCVSSRSSSLSLRCPSLSSSCGSLSSVGTSSWSESSNSSLSKSGTPPSQSPWKLPKQEAAESPLWIAGCKDSCLPASSTFERVPVTTIAGDDRIKTTFPAGACCTSVLPMEAKAGIPLDSFSLFCSSTDSVFCKNKAGSPDQERIHVAEYSLFGPARFSSTIIKVRE